MYDTVREAGDHGARAVYDTVREAGDHGAPAGPMYAALMSAGCTLEQFENLMSGMVGAGVLRKSGHLYYACEVPTASGT